MDAASDLDFSALISKFGKAYPSASCLSFEFLIMLLPGKETKTSAGVLNQRDLGALC